MGEAKRRQRVIEQRTFSRDEFVNMGSICAWEGCTATYRTPDGQPPPGWRIMYTLKRYVLGTLASGEPTLRVLDPKTGMERDSVLCPKHAAELENSLKDIGRDLSTPAQGSA